MDKRNLAENAAFYSSTVNTVRIGVLGGIGPEATGEFYNKLIRRLQVSGLINKNADFPQIIINSIPAQELVFDKISDADLKDYIDGLKFLDRSCVDFIVMVCNTIHLYYDQLQKEINTPILDLRKEVKQYLISKRGKVLVLGTPATIKNGLYEFSGAEYIRLTKKESKKISRSILQFNRGEKSIGIVSKITKKYRQKGARIILACTELAIMLENEKIPNINTIDVLVNATIDKFLSLKSKNSTVFQNVNKWNSGCKNNCK